ncbi:MAG: MarR family winged helix-turn-helix transcriptional regulator [Thalassovita sp.]
MTENDKFPLQQFLPYLLNQAAEESSLEFQKAYKDRYGMLRTEWRVLFHLGIYGRMTAKDIGQRSKMHKTKISRAVQRLAQRRFLTRTQDDGDRRLEHLDLTPAGRTAYLDLREIAVDYDVKLSSILTKEENVVLRQALVKLARMG